MTNMRNLVLNVAAACALAAVFASVACSRESGPSAQETGFPAAITLTPVAKGLKQPTAIANAGDGTNRLFVLEQRGTVRILRNGVLGGEPFLDIRRLVKSGGEQGLLGIAFPKQFRSTKIFYVNYTNRVGVGNTVVASFKVGTDPDHADNASKREILGIVQPYANHNGGQLAFGPDGFLYIGTGDGGSAGDPHGNGQKRDTLLGKLLRIEVGTGVAPYAIPKGNPFGNEIWAYGLRNPWRFSFDRGGDLYIADVGQNEVEEIDYLAAGTGKGANFGWNVMEGSRCFKKEKCDKAGMVPPVAEYHHGKGDCSVTGGYVYRGKLEQLKGIYLYGDFCSGRIWGLRQSGGRWVSRLLLETPYRISTFGEDEQGELYVADYGEGTIYRIGVP